MRRQEAEKLVGQSVQAWTSANGIYVGELIEVIAAGKWRGKVRITGVLSCAIPFEFNRQKQRRGFRSGDIIEVGGANISVTGQTGTSYLEALRVQLGAYEMMRRRGPERDWGWIDKSMEQIRERIKEEENPLTPNPMLCRPGECLRGGNWQCS